MSELFFIWTPSNDVIGQSQIIAARDELREMLSLEGTFIVLAGQSVLSRKCVFPLNWASWMMHPLSGYGLQFFLKAVELGKLQGNYLVEFVQKPARYTGGYLSPYERYKSRHPNELAGTLNDLTYAEGREFAPRVSEIGFRRPAEEIDDPDYVEKLARYTAFLKESGCKPRDQVCSGRLRAPHQCHLRCVWSGFL